jgi:hypothetical protein
MALDHSPDDLLAHFDHPKTIALHEASWVDPTDHARQPPAMPGVSELAQSLVPKESPEKSRPDRSHINRRSPLTHSRGIRWILKWSAALAVLFVAASQLIEFASLCSAEHSLSLAARAGAFEATLPRANYKSIAAAVDRKLVAYPQLSGQTQLTVLQNGRPISQQLRPGENDRISVTITAPASAFTPHWLLKLPQWSNDTHLTAHAERTTPSHKLRPEHSQTAAE